MGRRGSIAAALTSTIGKAAKQLTPKNTKSKKKKTRRHRRSYSSSSSSSSLDFESDSISSVSGSLSHASSSLSASHSSCSETYEYSYDRSHGHRSPHRGHHHNHNHRKDNKKHHRLHSNRRRRKRRHPRHDSHYTSHHHHSIDDDDSDRMIDLLMRIIPFHGQGDKGSDNVVIDTIHRLPPQALEMRDNDGNTLLMITCQAGSFGLLPILLSRGCDVNARNNVGASSLHYACFAETFSPNAAMTLVRHGAVAEVVETEFGCTPLHWAAYHGHVELCRVLCRAGANPATIDKNGCDPISYSRESGKVDCTELLESCRSSGGSSHVSVQEEKKLDWIRCMDGNMNSFYHNKETGESLWGDDFRSNIEEEKVDKGDDEAKEETKEEITPMKESLDVLQVVEEINIVSHLPVVEETKQADDGDGVDPIPAIKLPPQKKRDNMKRPTLKRLNSWDEELDEIKKQGESPKSRTSGVKETRALGSSSAATSTVENVVSSNQFEDRLSVLHEKLNNRLESLEEKMVQEGQIKDESAISTLQNDFAAMTTTTLDLKTQIGQKDLDILSLKQQIVMLETTISTRPRSFDVGVGVDITTSDDENDDQALAADAVEGKRKLAEAQDEIIQLRDQIRKTNVELNDTVGRYKETEQLLEIAEKTVCDEKTSRESLMHLFEQAKEGQLVDSALTHSLQDEKQRAETTINGLRQQLQVLKKESSTREAAAKDELLVQKAETEKLSNDLEQLTASHKAEISKLKEQHREEKERAIDSLTQYHRAELQKVNDDLREETLSKMEMEASKYEAIAAVETAQEKARSASAKLHEMTNLIHSSKHLEKNNEELNLSLQKETERRKALHNTIEDMKGRIRVYVRIRPLSESEIRSDSANVMTREDDCTIAMAADASTGVEARAWEFDKIFCGTSEDGNTQEAVFKDTSLLITSAIDGFNVCIFAYGKLEKCWQAL